MVSSKIVSSSPEFLQTIIDNNVHPIFVQVSEYVCACNLTCLHMCVPLFVRVCVLDKGNTK